MDLDLLRTVTRRFGRDAADRLEIVLSGVRHGALAGRRCFPPIRLGITRHGQEPKGGWAVLSAPKCRCQSDSASFVLGVNRSETCWLPGFADAQTTISPLSLMENAAVSVYRLAAVLEISEFKSSV